VNGLQENFKDAAGEEEQAELKALAEQVPHGTEGSGLSSPKNLAVNSSDTTMPVVTAFLFRAPLWAARNRR
jgi:hypothetical protein